MQAAHDESYLREMLVAIGSLTESKDVQLRGYTDEAVQMQIFAVKRYGLALSSMSVGLSRLSSNEGPRKALIGCLLVCCFEWLLGNNLTALRHAGSGIKILRQWLRSYQGRNYKTGLCSPDPRVIEDELVQAFLRLDKQVATFGDPETREVHKEVLDESNETVQNMPSIFSDVQEARLYLELLERRGIHFGYIAAGNCLKESTEVSTSIVLANQDRATELAYVQSLKGIIPQGLIKWKLAFDAFYATIPPSDAEQITGAKNLIAQSTAMRIIMSIAPGAPPPDPEKLFLEYESILCICDEILEETRDQRQLGNFKFEQGVIMPLHITAKWCTDRSIRRRAIDLLKSYRSSDGEPMREGVWDSETFAEWDECVLESGEGSEWGDGSERIGDGHMRRAAKDKNQIFRLSGPRNGEGSERLSSTGSPESERSRAMSGSCVELGDVEGWVEGLPVRTAP